MKRREPHLESEREEGRRESERILSVLILAAWIAYLAVIISGLFWGDWALIRAILISGIVLVVPFWLLKRGHLFASGFMLVLTVLVTVTAAATIGQGIRDVALIAYPVIIIYASLILNRVSFKISVLLTFAAIAWLVFGEASGLFVPQPIETPTWIDFLTIAAILSVAILVINLLATNMRKNLELARSEILQRNQAHEALRESETHYHRLLDQLPDAVFIHDSNGKLVEVNNEACFRLGYSKDELLQKHLKEVTQEKPLSQELGLSHPTELGLSQEGYAFALNQLHANGHATYTSEIITKTGKRFPCEIVMSLIQYKGQPMVLSISRDISERKRVETHDRLIAEVLDILLRPCEREDIYQLVSEKTKQLIGDGITATAILDEQRRTLRMGAYHGVDIPFEQLLSILRFDPRQKEFPLDSITEEGLNIYRKSNLSLLENGLYTLMTRLIPKPACLLIENLLHVQKVFGMGFVHKDEHLGGLIILARNDITPHIATIEQVVNLATIAIERKLAEESLQESEARYKNLFENNHAVMLILDPDSTAIVDANPAACSYYGWSHAEFLKKSISDINILATADVRAEMQLALTEKRNHFVFKHRRGNGTIRDVEVYSGPLVIASKPYLYSIIHDITERKRAEAALQESEERFKLSMDATNDGLWDWNIKAGEGYFSPGYYRMLGYPVGTFPMEYDAWKNLVHPEDLQRALQVNRNCIEGLCEQFEVEYRMKAKNGGWRWILMRGKCIVRDEQQRALRLLGTIMDITERKQAEEAQNRLLNKLQTHQIELKTQNEELLQIRQELDAALAKYFDLYDLAPTGYLTLNAAGMILEANLSAANLLGVSKIELCKQSLTDFIYIEDQDIHYLHQNRLFDTRAPQVCELRIVGKAGALHWVRLEAKLAHNSDGTPAYWETISDITERKLAEEHLGYTSTHDALTGIYNRSFFEVELARLEHSREFPISIAMADVDQLKVINDTQGHAAGDELIRQAANALRAVFREADVLARIGGDEFAVILPGTDSANAEQMLARVRELLAKHNAETLDFPVQLSLGTATAERNNLTEAFMLADQRMYADKATRKAMANCSHAS